MVEYSQTTYLRGKSCFHDTPDVVETLVAAVGCCCRPQDLVNTDVACWDSS